MTTTTLTKAAESPIPETTCPPGVTARGVADMRGSLGGLLTFKLRNNGALGVQAVANISVAHTAGETPAPTAGSSVWKTVYSVGGGVTSMMLTEWSYRIPPEAMHVLVEIGSTHTANNITCEAMLSKIMAAESV